MKVKCIPKCKKFITLNINFFESASFNDLLSLNNNKNYYEEQFDLLDHKNHFLSIGSLHDFHQTNNLSTDPCRRSLNAKRNQRQFDEFMEQSTEVVTDHIWNNINKKIYSLVNKNRFTNTDRCRFWIYEQTSGRR